MTTIAGVHHVQLGIPKGAEDAARRFYGGMLGLRELPKPEILRARGGLWFELPGGASGDSGHGGESACQIHLGIEDGADRAASRAHVAYRVTGLAEWRARLEREGIAIQEGAPIPGYARFEFRDPFGNRVEFIERVG